MFQFWLYRKQFKEGQDMGPCISECTSSKISFALLVLLEKDFANFASILSNHTSFANFKISARDGRHITYHCLKI